MHLRKAVGIPFIVLAIGGSASADPVQVTSGGIFLDFEGDFFRLQGKGFDIQAAHDYANHFPLEPVDSCFPCRPGDILNFSFSTPGEVDAGSGEATFGGQSYAQLFYRAQFEAIVPLITFPDTSDGIATFRPPFVLTGSLRAFHDPEFSRLAFATALRGRGTVFPDPFTRGEDGAYSHLEGQTGYLFQEAAPVPEPATIGLAALGLATLAARRRRVSVVRGTRL